jgi:hypothetical protein
MRAMRPSFAAAAALAAALLAASPARAAQAYAVSVEGLARDSDAVVRGKVASASAHRSDDGRRIYTTYEVQTKSVLRGRAPAIARVVVPGGVDGRLGQRVDAAPQLARGEELILFLRRSGTDTFVVTELAQGKFSVVGPVARPDLSQFTFMKTVVPSGERRAEEMPVAELEQRVRNTR